MQIDTFEIFNDKGVRVFFTYDKSCIPIKEHVNAMFKNGYKFKINGKAITKKSLLEFIK